MLADRSEKISKLKLAIGAHNEESVKEKFEYFLANDYPALLDKDILSSTLILRNLQALTLYLICLKPKDRLNILNQTDNHGLTPLHQLLRKSSKSELPDLLPFIKLLISNGSNITIISNNNISSLKLLSRFEKSDELFSSSVIKGFTAFDAKYKLEIVEHFKRAFMRKPFCSFRKTIYVRCAMLISLQLGVAAHTETESILLTHIQSKHKANDKNAFTPENLKTICTINALELIPSNLKKAAKFLKGKGDNETAEKLTNYIKTISSSSSAIKPHPNSSFQRKNLLRNILTNHIRDVNNIIMHLNAEDEYSLKRKLLGILIVVSLLSSYAAIVSLLIYYIIACEKSDKGDCTLLTTNTSVGSTLGFFFLIPMVFYAWLSNWNVPLISDPTKRPPLKEEIYKLKEKMSEFTKKSNTIKTYLTSLNSELTNIRTSEQTVTAVKASFNSILVTLKKLREEINTTELEDDYQEELADIETLSPQTNEPHEFDTGPSTSGSNDIEMTTYRLISSIDNQEENLAEETLTLNRKNKKGKERISLFTEIRKNADKPDEEDDDEEKQLLSSSNAP